jgi:uncharacterized protein
MKRLFVEATAALALTLAPIMAVAQDAPKIRTLSAQEVDDLIVGSMIQGTRASDTQAALKSAHDLLARGGRFRVIEPQDLPDDWSVVMVGGGVSGGDSWDYVSKRIVGQNRPMVDNPTLLAMKALAQYTGKTFQAVLRNEADGATLGAFVNADAAGLPVVDACPAGRAKPDVQLSIPFANGLSVTPAAVVSRWGDVVLMAKTIDDYRYEDMARALSVASGGYVAQARGVMTGADVKRATILGAVSEAILFGRTVREAAEHKADPIKALLKASGGYPLFRGTVTKAERSGERGFTWWTVEIAGTGAYAGHTYRVWVKNENMFTWLDGKPDVTAPDYIYNLDPHTGWAATSGELGGYEPGKAVVMIGRPAAAAWRTPRGLDLTDPHRFGFDIAFKPIEEVMRTRPKFGE